jgi:hypothetical protein
MDFRFFVFLLLAVSTEAYSGGTDWGVAVDQIERRGNDYTLHLRSVDSLRHQPMGCKNLVVHGEYTWLRWWLFDEALTSEKHKDALDYLDASRKSGNGIRFGSMGAGLDPIKHQPCHFTSHGLMFMKDRTASAVYSFYQPIDSRFQYLLAFGMLALLVAFIWLIVRLAR